jgi:hypothetical protein
MILNKTQPLALVRTSAQRKTPLALKLSAAIVFVESGRTLPLLLGPTGLPSLPFRVYPITTQMHCLCQFLSYRFKNFSPETLVTFFLRLFSHINMPSLRFCVSPRTRVIHTWTAKHPTTSVVQKGSMIVFLMVLGISLVTGIVDVFQNVMNPGFY